MFRGHKGKSEKIQRIGNCHACVHCVDIGRVAEDADGKQTMKVGCRHPITEPAWDWRSLAAQRSYRLKVKHIEGGPTMAEDSPLRVKWPVSFLPENVLFCPLFEERLDHKRWRHENE